MALRILVNPARTQLFPLAGVSGWAELLGTYIRPGAVHRCRELGRLIRDAGAAVLYAPHPLFAPVICPCPMVVTIHDCIIEANARHAGGWHRQLGLKVVTNAMLRRSAAVTAPTRATLDEIRRHYPGAPPAQIAELGLQSRVRLVPEVAEELLAAVYRAAWVFAFPSVVEGYGLPVLEAMAAGVPVVASAIPSLAEVCGSAAVLVPPDDASSWASALLTALEDGRAASGMVEAGRAVVADATWEMGSRALGDLLSSVVHATSSGTAVR